MSFERIVRPFQTIPFTPVARVVPTEEDELEDIVLEIGKDRGSVKTMQGSWSSSITAFTIDEGEEITRDVVVRRVENPNDPSQYVDVEDTSKVKWSTGKKDTYKETELTLKTNE